VLPLGTGKGAINYVGIWVEVYVASVRMPWYGERGVNSGTDRKGGAGEKEGAVWLKVAKLGWRRCGCMEEVA